MHRVARSARRHATTATTACGLAACSGSPATSVTAWHRRQRVPVSTAALASASPNGGTAAGAADSAASSLPPRKAIPGVSHVILSSSVKGGVGKSTVAANLACALRRDLGLAVGVLDADIYGPSLHVMLRLASYLPGDSDEAGSGENEGKKERNDDGNLNCSDENDNSDKRAGAGTPVGSSPAVASRAQRRPRVDPRTKKFDPVVAAHNVKAFSMGLLTPEPDSALVWRGPVATTALNQLLYDVAWAPLDVLLVDTPPGTGDVLLTLAQRVPVSGAIVVSTPQHVAVADARRGTRMFRSLDVPLLGVVENMAYVQCGKCGEREHVFGHGGADALAAHAGCDVIGRLPLMSALCAASDAGEVGGTAREEFARMASNVAHRLDIV